MFDYKFGHWHDWRKIELYSDHIYKYLESGRTLAENRVQTHARDGFRIPVARPTTYHCEYYVMRR